MKLSLNIWNVQLVFLLLSISTFAFLNLGFLPLNLSHIIVLLMFSLQIGLVLLGFNMKVNKLYIFFVFLFSLLSIYSIFIIYDSQKIKNIINFFIFFTVTALVLNNCEKEKIIVYYFKMSKVFIFFAILQMMLYYLRLGNLFNFSFLGLKEVNISTSGVFIRLFSITSEPAALCGVLLPAIYLSINRIINKEKDVGLIYSCLVLFVILNTFSLIGYIYLLFAIIIASYYGGKISFGKLVIVIISIVLFVFILLQSESIQQRVSEVTSIERISSSENLSVMAVYSNILIAFKVLNEHILFGGGIFNHPYFYDAYIGNFYSGGAPRVELNKDDAASLYTRALSEIGLIGLFLFIGFNAYLLNKCRNNSYYYPYTIAFAFSFIMLGLRAGSVNYVIIWFYFFSAIRFLSKETNR